MTPLELLEDDVELFAIDWCEVISNLARTVYPEYRYVPIFLVSIINSVIIKDGIFSDFERYIQ